MPCQSPENKEVHLQTEHVHTRALKHSHTHTLGLCSPSLVRPITIWLKPGQETGVNHQDYTGRRVLAIGGENWKREWKREPGGLRTASAELLLVTNSVRRTKKWMRWNEKVEEMIKSPYSPIEHAVLRLC